MKRIHLVVALVYSFSSPGAAMSYTGLTPDDMLQMMRAMASMARMWNVFFELGNWGTAPSKPFGFGWPDDGWLGLRPGQSTWPESWSLAGMHNFSSQGKGISRGGQWGQSTSYLSAGSPLEGTWQGLSGEIVILRANRFLIRSPSGQTVHGIFMTYGNRMIVYCVESDNVCLFVFGLKENMLAFKSQSGDVLPFRRLNRPLPW